MSLQHKELKRPERVILSIGSAFGIATIALLFTKYDGVSILMAIATLFAFFFWAGMNFADQRIIREARDKYLDGIQKIAGGD